MAKILVKTAGLSSQLLELKLGVNRIGRNAENDFQLEHPSVSGSHCEFVVTDSSLVLRDLESTNGTFVNGAKVREFKLSPGETVHVGEVELWVESTAAAIVIPRFVDRELPAPPVVVTDGSMICPRHSQAKVSYKCTHCKEVMCTACVHKLRRKGSKNTLLLCPLCSHAVELIAGAAVAKPKKKSLLSRVTETVKLKLTGIIQTRPRP